MNIVLVGAQGSGKGIVSQYLTENYKYKHISTGDLFREEISKNTELGKILASYMNNGHLVPDEIVLSVFKKVSENADNLLIDGFPRTYNQAIELDKILNIDLVINVDVPREMLVDRMLARRNCPICKKSFNLMFYKSNTCDVCNADLVQREDDKLDAINKRLEIFYSNITQILDFYNKKGIVRTLDNSGELTTTYENLENILKNFKK